MRGKGDDSLVALLDDAIGDEGEGIALFRRCSEDLKGERRDVVVKDGEWWVDRQWRR